MRPFVDPRTVTGAIAEILLPPRRIRPSEAVRRYLRNHEGEWNPALATMQIEPLDELARRQYTGIVYVGPARGSKTYTLIIGGLTYIVTCAPGDTLIVQMSQDKAREFSKKDVDRSIRHSPELAARLSPRPRDDNVFDKFWRSGMALNFGWPAVTQLSGSTFKYTLITDYDRPENRDDVDGEGSLWDLAAARVRTFMSRGKCLAESSPGGEYADPQWRPTTPHEAPPATGILAIYNRGTRARWYWPCKGCGEYFQAKPGLGNFSLPDFEELEQEVQRKDLMTLAEGFARIACPECGVIHEPQDKPRLNELGTWLHEGESIDGAGRRVGDRRRTQIASYWQGGVSATYQSWTDLLLKYLQGVLTYVRTSDESTLKTTTNTDQAAPYLPRAIANRRSADELMNRCEEWPRGSVPAGVRFLTAAVDVQAGRFVVEVFGWGVGLEAWLVDRFVITSSRREEGERFAALEPAAYLEDWEILTEQVIDRTYAVNGRPVALGIRLVVCDSGGKAGVSSKAYAFYRLLKRLKKHRNFYLVKGASRIDAPTAQLSWPDASDRKDRKQGGRGDVPVWMLNTTVLKDAVVGDLARTEPGPGYVHLPEWLRKEEEFFAELTAEKRTDKGWVKPPGVKNEAFDLHVYNRAACKILKADRINWQQPPEWAIDLQVQPPPPAPTQPPAPAAPSSTWNAPRSGGWMGQRKGWMKR